MHRRCEHTYPYFDLKSGNETPITSFKVFLSFFTNKTNDLVTYLDKLSIEHDQNLFKGCFFGHIRYRCKTKEQYQKLKHSILQSKKVPSTHISIVNGREILLFKLIDPISKQYGGLQFFEICDQKDDEDQKAVFHHFEMVYKNRKDFKETETFLFFNSKSILTQEVRKREGVEQLLFKIIVQSGVEIFITTVSLYDIALRRNM